MPIKRDHLDKSTDAGNYVSVLVIDIIAVYINVASSAATIYYWKKRMMQHTHPLLTMSNFVGSMVFASSSISLVGINTETNCTARVYLFNLSFTLAFCPYLIKAVKFYQTLVLAVKVSGFRGTRSIVEVLPISIFLFIDIIIISVTLYTSGGRGATPYTIMELQSDGSYHEYTYCGYHDNRNLFWAELIYKSIMIFSAIYLAYSLRIVLFKFCMVLSIDTAIKATVGSAMLALWVFLDDIPTAITCAAAGICVSAIVTGSLNAIPAIMIATLGDQDAIGDIVEGMFDKKKEQDDVSTERGEGGEWFE